MPADLPPIGTLWGDLTAEQRDCLPVGTVLAPPPENPEWGTLELVPGGWSTASGYVLGLMPPVPNRPILSYPDPILSYPDPRPSTVTIRLTPALYARARAAGMPEGERNIGEWLVSRAEVAATARREALEEAARECEGLGKTTTTGSIVRGVCDRVAVKIRALAKKEAP